jgi:hypothetical protein
MGSMFGLKQAGLVLVLARRSGARGLYRKVKQASTQRRRELELLRKRRRATEGVRGHVVAVRLPQPKGAGGLQPPRGAQKVRLTCCAR